MTMHICTRCRERKSDREYYPNGRGGLMAHCAHCERAAVRDRYHGENRRRIQKRVLANYHRKRADRIDDHSDDENGSAAA